MIGVSSGLVLGGLAAIRARRRRSERIKMLRDLCLWWIEESRKEHANGRFIVTELSRELTRYLPVAASFLTADEAVRLSRGRSWLAGRAEDKRAPAPGSTPDQRTAHWRNVLVGFDKYVPFLKLDLDRHD